MTYDAIVIGAGAAALFFGALNKDKLNILMLERNDRVGKKLLTTGNGRCNNTNTKLNENPYNDKVFTSYIIEKHVVPLHVQNPLPGFSPLFDQSKSL